MMWAELLVSHILSVACQIRKVAWKFSRWRAPPGRGTFARHLRTSAVLNTGAIILHDYKRLGHIWETKQNQKATSKRSLQKGGH